MVLPFLFVFYPIPLPLPAPGTKVVFRCIVLRGTFVVRIGRRGSIIAFELSVAVVNPTSALRQAFEDVCPLNVIQNTSDDRVVAAVVAVCPDRILVTELLFSLLRLSDFCLLFPLFASFLFFLPIRFGFFPRLLLVVKRHCFHIFAAPHSGNR